ncbi:MAG: hypothetical protein AAFU85_14855 [Planctomycetota bacterium]
MRATNAKPVTWLGDLTLDCPAEWASMALRAQQVQEGTWRWWIHLEDERSQRFASEILRHVGLLSESSSEARGG